MIKPCLAIVGGIIGIYIGVKLLLSFDKPRTTYM